MALFEWTPALSVGVTEFDGHHQKLVGMINDLNDAMAKGKSKEVMAQILDGLIQYTGMHFSAEEKNMDQFGYLQTFQHKTEHKNLVKKVLDFQKGFKEGKLMLSMELMNFLKDWLQHHILETDKKYRPFFNQNGLK